MSAHAAEGLRVDDREVLVRIGAEVGLAPHARRHALDRDEGAAEVAADLEEGRDVRVSGVPFFALDRRSSVSGAQPTELFTEALARGWAGVGR